MSNYQKANRETNWRALYIVCCYLPQIKQLITGSTKWKEAVQNVIFNICPEKNTFWKALWNNEIQDPSGFILHLLRVLQYGPLQNLSVRVTNITNSKVKVQYSGFKDPIMAYYQLALLLYLSFRGQTAEISLHTVFFTDEMLSIKYNPATSGLLVFPAMFIYGI